MIDQPIVDTNPYGDLEPEVVPSESTAHACTDGNLVFPEISDAQVQQIHDEIDDLLSAEAPSETDFDPTSSLLPPGIRQALRKRLPREAIQRFANMTPMIDADGNQLLVRETAVKVQAVVVDYIADKIFGERLSFEVVGHGVTKAGHVNIIYTPGSEPRSVYQVVAWAKVRCSVLRNDGTSWIKEDYSSMAAETDKDTNHGRAHRIAEMGAVTAARRRALQQYGRVFGGFDIRDFENLIGTIKQKQKQQEAKRRQADQDAKSQEEAFAADAAPSSPKKQAPKPPLAVEPGLKSGVPAAAAGNVTPAKPSGVTVKRKNAPKPKTTVFPLKSAADAEPAQITDAAIFAKQLVKLLARAKTIEAANELIALTRESIARIERVEGGQAHATQIMSTHEVRVALLSERKKTAEEKRQRRELLKKRKLEAERRAAASTAADAAAEAATQGTVAKDLGAEPPGSGAPEPRRPLSETPDHAGFGGASTPEPETGPAKDEAAPAAWNPTMPKLEVVDGKLAVGPFGQALLDLVREAPTIADLDALMKKAKPDLERVNREAAIFITSEADLRRKKLKP